jgi:alkyldihydroxyacetonephosphate synthase
MTAAPARSIWGWGYQAEGPSEASLNRVLAALFPAFPEHASLPLFDLQLAIKRLREPRFKLPSEIKGICSQDPQERLRHTYGKSFKDVARAFSGSFDNAPDYVGMIL